MGKRLIFVVGLLCAGAIIFAGEGKREDSGEKRDRRHRVNSLDPDFCQKITEENKLRNELYLQEKLLCPGIQRLAFIDDDGQVHTNSDPKDRETMMKAFELRPTSSAEKK